MPDKGGPLGLGYLNTQATMTGEQHVPLGEHDPKGHMTGWVTELVRRTQDGTSVEHRTVFRPKCKWYDVEARDFLGEIIFTDPEAFTNEVGHDVAQRVSDGEIVQVVIKRRPGLEFRGGCHHNAPVKRVYAVRYPYPGTQEDLLFGGA